jgi:hypothetical protein
VLAGDARSKAPSLAPPTTMCDARAGQLGLWSHGLELAFGQNILFVLFSIPYSCLLLDPFS